MSGQRGGVGFMRAAAVAALAAVFGMGESALAQTKAAFPSPSRTRGLVGVRSKAPRITRPISTQTLPIHRRNTLLPQRRSSPGGVGGGDFVMRPRTVVGRPVRDGFRSHPAVVNDGAVVRFGTGGFVARGSFSDGDNSVVFRVGSGVRTLHPHHGRRRVHRHCGYGHYGLGLLGYYDRDYYAPTVYYAGYADPFVLSGQTYAQQAAAQQAAAAAAEMAQPPQLTPIEEAELALQSGDAAEAVRLLRAYLESHTEQARVIRLLALALFEDGRLEEAVATMSLAYERDPGLAARPVDASALEGDNSDMLNRVRRAVAHAHKVKSGSAWLTVAVLMQAQERRPVAMKMVERGKKAGLAEPVYREFKVALGG